MGQSSRLKSQHETQHRLNHSNDIPEFVVVENGKENDMVQGRKFQFPAGSIVVFDKGYVDYQWYVNLTAQNIDLSHVLGLNLCIR